MKVETQPKVDHTPAELDEPSRILLRAAAMIEVGGWCRGWLEHGGAHCVDGAMNKAATGDHHYHRENEALCEASRRFARAVGYSLPSDWNNNVAKNKDEVVAKLRAVALGL